MARLPYADTDTSEARPLVEKIVAQRGAAYNMVSRFLEALQIRSDDTRP